MSSNIKIDSYLSNCNSECRKRKHLDYLYYKYLDYYQKYSDSYYNYLVYKDGNNTSTNSNKYREYLNEMNNIDKLMKKGIDLLDTQIIQNKNEITTNNSTINKLLINNQFFTGQYTKYRNNIHTYNTQYKNKIKNNYIAIQYYAYYLLIIGQVLVIILLLIYLSYK